MVRLAIAAVVDGSCLLVLLVYFKLHCWFYGDTSYTCNSCFVLLLQFDRHMSGISYNLYKPKCLYIFFKTCSLEMDKFDKSDSAVC
jgi:hypothetical protein